MKFRSLIATVVGVWPLLHACVAISAVTPTGGVLDSRIGHITYQPDEVFRIATDRGVSTLIVLEDGESITKAGTGFDSKCKDDAAEWCIVADKGDHVIWVKPKPRATFNNMELITNKRIYSFEFDAHRAPAKATASNLYRVVFDYPKPHAENGKPTPDEIVATRMHSTKPVVVNWNYTMQALAGGESFEPIQAFDDTRLTYFLIPGNRDMPTVYVVGSDGSEREVDSNIDPATGYVVVHETAKQFRLRLGKAVVGIWNESDLPELPATNDGTTVQGVRRVFK